MSELQVLRERFERAHADSDRLEREDRKFADFEAYFAEHSKLMDRFQRIRIEAACLTAGVPIGASMRAVIEIFLADTSTPILLGYEDWQPRPHE